MLLQILEVHTEIVLRDVVKTNIFVRMDLNKEEALDRLRDAIQADVDRYDVHIQESSRRAHKLINAASADADSRDDILRAVVVLTHAYLEDLLRTIGRALLPRSGEGTLNKIPLAGLEVRAEKFQLGQLLRHKGKKVDEIIRESVEQYLDRSTFNNTTEIKSFLDELGLAASGGNEFLADINTMIQRRHQIVHRADRVKQVGSQTYQLASIEDDDVLKWVESTYAYMNTILFPAVSKMYTPAVLKEAFNIEITNSDKKAE